MREPLPDRQLALLRYLRDRDGAGAAAIATDVFGLPRTTFGRVPLRTALEDLSQLAERGLVFNRGGDAARGEWRITLRGRGILAEIALGTPLAE